MVLYKQLCCIFMQIKPLHHLPFECFRCLWVFIPEFSRCFSPHFCNCDTCFYPKQSINISYIPATIKGKHRCLKCPIKSSQFKHWSFPGSFHRRPLSPLKWGSSTVVLTVFLDTSVTYDKDGTWAWWCLRAERQPNMFAHFALTQGECCAEWEEHATSQSLPSVSRDPVLKEYTVWAVMW